MRVLTAIGNDRLREVLKRKGFEICSYDIQYKEGVLEFIEGKGFTDYIVIDYTLPGELELQELVNKILEINPLIKIVIINLDKTVKLSKVYKCFANNDIETVVQFLIIDSDSEETFKQQYNGKIVTILGTSGVGKSVFSINLANVLKCEKKLIIDFDVLNNSLHYLLGINDYTNKVQTNIKKNILDFSYKQALIQEEDQKYNVDMTPIVLKTNFNVDLISGVNLIFDTKSQLDPQTIKSIILKFKKTYEVVIIDTSSQCFMDYNKEIMKISDELIFLSGANLYEVQKSKLLLKKYTEEYKIDQNKFYIVFNKCSKNSIDEEILREFFREYKVLGKIKLRDYYEYIINKNKSKQKKISREMKHIEKRGGFGGKSIREYTRPKYFNRKLRKSTKHIS